MKFVGQSSVVTLEEITSLSQKVRKHRKIVSKSNESEVTTKSPFIFFDETINVPFVPSLVKRDLLLV